MLLAIVGGIMALKRVHCGWALAGAICSLTFPFTGIPAIILLVKRKGEFQEEKEYGGDSYKRGQAYYESGEYHKAIAEYNKAIELNPNLGLAYFNRAYAYGEIGKYDEAIADYSKAIELNPGDAQAHYNRGLDYYNKGEVSKAVSDLEKCIGLSTEPELTKDAKQALLETKNSTRGKKVE